MTLPLFFCSCTKCLYSMFSYVWPNQCSFQMLIVPCILKGISTVYCCSFHYDHTFCIYTFQKIRSETSFTPNLPLRWEGCNEIYYNIMLRFKFGFIFRNYKFYYLWNQEMVSHLFTAVTAYHSKPYNSSYLEYFQLPLVAWSEEFLGCYFVSINATDFGYWTHSLNTHQDDYTTREPAVAYHQC